LVRRFCQRARPRNSSLQHNCIVNPGTALHSLDSHDLESLTSSSVSLYFHHISRSW
jgi:hypothetical protein